VHVDAVGRGEARELVGQADVDVAVGGLGQLRHLGGFGTAQVPDPVAALQIGALVELQHLLVEGPGPVGTRRVEAADELGVATQVGEDPAGEDPLRGEDEVEVAPFDQSRHRSSVGFHRVRVVPTGKVVS
jgi:hypothetical protein